MAPKIVLFIEILGKADLRAVLNKGCQTGEMILPANIMPDIADGVRRKSAREKAASFFSS